MGVFSHRKGGTVERFKTFLTCPPLTLNTIVVVHPTCKPVTLPAVSLSILNLKQLVAYLFKTMSHFYDTCICGASAYHRKIISHNLLQYPCNSSRGFSTACHASCSVVSKQQRSGGRRCPLGVLAVKRFSSRGRRKYPQKGRGAGGGRGGEGLAFLEIGAGIGSPRSLEVAGVYSN